MKFDFIYFILSFIIVCGICLGCKKSNQEPISNSDCPAQIIIDQSQFVSARIDDHEILDAVIEDNELKLKIQYSGGCGEITPGLLTNGIFMESLPVQLGIKFSFVDEDNCEALIQENICFSLSDLAEHYKRGYQTDSGTIIMRLQNHEGELEYSF